MKIGIMLPQEWEINQTDPVEAYETMTRIAQEAEALGFDFLWLFDHFHSITTPDMIGRMIFECWTSIAAIARNTTRIRFGPMVSCNGFRHPALLAKMASTIDVLSHGRLEFGIGAGNHQVEYLAYGYPFPAAPVRLQQLKEAVQIIRAMWSEEEVYFAGKYYQVDGAINQPKGVQKPHIPLTIGGKGEHVTLRLVAKYADACNFTSLTLEEIQRKHVLLRRYCEEIERDPSEIRRTIYLNGYIGATEAEAIARYSRSPGKYSLEHIRSWSLLGTPDAFRSRLQELEGIGVQEVTIALRDVAQLEPLHLLAQAVKS